MSFWQTLASIAIAACIVLAGSMCWDRFINGRWTYNGDQDG